MKRSSVDSALAVAKSDLAKATTARYDFLTIEQAAAIAEFDDDREAVKALVVAAKDGRFDHIVGELREQRSMRLAYEQVADELASMGVRIIDRPSLRDETTRLEKLRQDDAPVTEANHGSCPGHAAWLDDEWHHPSGDDADEDDEGWTIVYRPVFVCTAPSEYGHTGALLSRPVGGAQATASSATTVDEVAAEAARQERRAVLANNKAWRAAEPVRREWLSAFLKRKQSPKGGLRFVIAALVHGDYDLRDAMQNGHGFAAEVLGIELAGTGYWTNRQSILDAIAAATDNRAQVIALGLVLCAAERPLDVHTWRRPDAPARRYFTALREWGYVLSAVEQLVVDAPESDEEGAA